jgi:hypothetical protein
MIITVSDAATVPTLLGREAAGFRNLLDQNQEASSVPDIPKTENTVAPLATHLLHRK